MNGKNGMAETTNRTQVKSAGSITSSASLMTGMSLAEMSVHQQISKLLIILMQGLDD